MPDCKSCAGDGKLTCHRRGGTGTHSFMESAVCRICGASGRQDCAACGGKQGTAAADQGSKSPAQRPAWLLDGPQATVSEGKASEKRAGPDKTATSPSANRAATPGAAPWL